MKRTLNDSMYDATKLLEYSQTRAVAFARETQSQCLYSGEGNMWGRLFHLRFLYNVKVHMNMKYMK